MTSFLFSILFRLFSLLPLPVLHSMGKLLGKVTFRLSQPYAQRTQENLRTANLSSSDAEYFALLKQTVAEGGKSICELPWVWTQPLEAICAKVQLCEGWQHVTAAQAAGKGMIFLTPHWGSFEVFGLYVGQRMALTNLYRAPKQTWLENAMRNGRQRGLAKLAPADVGGVRLLYKALKRGEAIGLLPDQVPANGEGEWVNFFNRPAYTMTLSGRLAQSSGAAVLLAYTERLPDGRGYVIRIEPLQLDFAQSVPLQINQALERVIATAPAQYLWSYNRYKTPTGVANPQSQIPNPKS
jgi:KDO2-lipid IV(A) lauroyltransferase